MFDYDFNKITFMKIYDACLENGQSLNDLDEMDIFHFLDLLIYRKYASRIKDDINNTEYVDNMVL